MEKEIFIDNQFEDNNYLICEACGNKMTENKCKLNCWIELPNRVAH